MRIHIIMIKSYLGNVGNLCGLDLVKQRGYLFTKPYNCKDVVKGILRDNKGSKKLKTNDKCPYGYYRIALFRNKAGREFHFYREDSNGYWSHKNGWRKATNKDCRGELIKDPRKAVRGIYEFFAVFLWFST